MPEKISAKLGEWMPDNPDRDNPGVIQAKNLIPHKTSYRPVRNIVEESDALDGVCRGAVALTDYTGQVHNYAGDLTKLYERSGSTYTDISRSIVGGSSADGYLVPDTHNWQFARMYNNVVAANGSSVLQEQLGFSGNFEDLIPDAGVPGNVDPTPALRYIAEVRNILLGGWLSTSTNLVKWSGLENHRVWTPTVQQSGEQPLQRGGEVTGIVGGEYGVIFCEESIYRVNYIGAPEVFQFDEVSPGHGTQAPGSIAQYGDNVFFIDKDGFYLFDGAKAVPIGSNKVNDTFLDDFDSEFANRVISAVDLTQSLIWWAYPSKSAPFNSEGQRTPDKIIVYDWTTGRFSGPIELNVEFLAYSETPASYLLDDVTPTNFPAEATIAGPCYEGGADPTCIDADQFQKYSDAKIFKGGTTQMQAFSFNHRQSSFTGAFLTAVVETGEYSLNPGGRAVVTGVRPQIEGDSPTITVQVGTRQNTYGSPDWSVQQSLHPRTGLANFRKNGRYHRFRFTVSGEFTHVFGGDVEFEAAGDL